MSTIDRNSSQSIEPSIQGGNSTDIKAKPLNKVAESSKTPLSELNQLSGPNKLDESRKLTKQELNDENSGTEEKTHEVAKTTLLATDASSEENPSISSKPDLDTETINDSTDDSI